MRAAFPPSLHPLSIAQAIAAAARRTPRRVALVVGEARLSYRELEAAIGDAVAGTAAAVSLDRLGPLGESIIALLRALAPAGAIGDERRICVAVRGTAGASIALDERTLLLRALDLAVTHPALGRDLRVAMPLALDTADGVVAMVATFVLGGTLVAIAPGQLARLAALIAADAIDVAWVGPPELAAIGANIADAALPAPGNALRLALCTELPAPAVRERLLAWLGRERVRAQTSDDALGPLRRHAALDPNGDAAVGVLVPRASDPTPPRRLALTIADGMLANATARADKPAIVIGARQLTFAQLADRIARVAGGAIADLGLAPGDRVAVLLPNCLEYFEIVCGFAQARVPAVLMPPMAIESEVRFILEDSGASVLICDATTEAVGRAAAHGLARRVIVLGHDYDAWLARSRAPATLPAIAETDLFSIPYTSGATGKPKGILLSHRSRVLTAYAAAAEYGALGPDTRMLVSTPVFHGAGFLNLLAPVWFGGTAFILPKFTIEGLLELVATHRLNAAHMVPAHFAAYFALDAATRARFDTSSLRSIVSGTAPLAQAMKERIVEAFGADVLNERYGSTEASIVTNLRPADQLRKLACVGLPFIGVEVEIRGADGRVLGPNQPGELWSRSPIMFSGYWNRPEAEATAIRDGWVSAGDIAQTDDEGYVYLVDRKNDMIISGGENIYPREVEEVLMRHPAVAEVAVIGMPHDYWGEAVTAFVHLRAGTNATADDLARHCAAALARWKLPKAIHTRGPLPRNAMGKILRRTVKDEAINKENA